MAKKKKPAEKPRAEPRKGRKTTAAAEGRTKSGPRRRKELQGAHIKNGAEDDSTIYALLCRGALRNSILRFLAAVDAADLSKFTYTGHPDGRAIAIVDELLRQVGRAVTKKGDIGEQGPE